MLKTLPYANGQLLAFNESGDPHGFPILIQHGLIASIEDMQLFDRMLERKTRLISIARPGYGQSTPFEMPSLAAYGQVAAALVEHLQLGQFDVLGISSGAPYSYAIARHFPTQCRQLFILSGTPALYDPQVRAAWPYPLQPESTIAEMQALSRQIFFDSLPPEALSQPDIRDSIMNNGFGVAQDLRLRAMLDWGFRLEQIEQPAHLRHSRADDSVPFACAERTAALLPHAHLDARPIDPHFSAAVLDDVLQTTLLEQCAS